MRPAGTAPSCVALAVEDKKKISLLFVSSLAARHSILIKLRSCENSRAIVSHLETEHLGI